MINKKELLALFSIPLFLCCTTSSVTSLNLTELQNYKKQYPNAPDGQAEFIIDTNFQNKFAAAQKCIISSPNYFHLSVNHLPELQLKVWAVGATELISQCANDPVLSLQNGASFTHGYEVNYSKIELITKYTEMSKALERASLEYRADLPTTKNQIVIKVLNDNVARARVVLSQFPDNSFNLKGVEVLPSYIIETGT